MQNSNAVLFKGKKNGITILLDNKMDFETLKDALRRKVADAGSFFSGTRTNITFKGRELSESEETELLEIIRQSNININFVGESGESEESAGEIPPLYVFPGNNAGEGRTVFHRGALRSGQAIHYTGSVVVLGDVNPGGEVIASGNIIILGSLKGLVHAGCKGDKECFISALDMSPTQLRIADIITYIPEELTKKNKKKSKDKKTGAEASYAYIKNGQIYIAPLMN